jgi:AraC-like DNA-binding protein
VNGLSGLAMQYQYYKPNQLLTDYVRTVLVIEGCRDAGFESHPIFTNGMPTLFCKTENGDTVSGNVLQLSLFTTPIPEDRWTINSSTTVIAYFFKPFVLTSIFKVAAKALIKNSMDLTNWSPHKFNALKTQLIYADTVTRKMEVLDNLLIQQHIENRDLYQKIQYATETIMRNPKNEILTDILVELKMNERTFQRIFKKYVGITPTQYRRINQFQLSFDQLRTKQYDKVSDVAFDNGFADQSHFIRTFKEFTDITPNDYLQHGLTEKK